MKGRKFQIYCSVILLVFFIYGKNTRAQDMTEIHHLDFGTFALKENNSAHTIVVAPDNSVTYDSAIVVGVRAQRGEYALTGLTPSISLGITLDNTVNLSWTGGTGSTFAISNYTTNSPSTNGAGDATLYIGATLTTNGNGNLYNNGDYHGTVDLTINF